jgi:hypothetical protein
LAAFVQQSASEPAAQFEGQVPSDVALQVPGGGVMHADKTITAATKKTEEFRKFNLIQIHFCQQV